MSSAARSAGRTSISPLRDDISTDEITPLPSLVHYDDEIGRHAHTGFRAGEAHPIPLDGLRDGGFGILVAGRRYGKGSSREHSPLAEYTAGIRLVIAESFERIYRQNCDNIGLFTSTDLGLVDRIKAGEAIPLTDLLEGRDALAAEILSAGGLLKYGQNNLMGLAPQPAVPVTEPRTLVQKIIERNIPASGGLQAGHDGPAAADRLAAGRLSHRARRLDRGSRQGQCRARQGLPADDRHHADRHHAPCDPSR